MTNPVQFIIYLDHMNEWRWRAVRSCPKGLLTIADSGEGYKSRFNATRAVHDLQASVRAGNFNTFGESAHRPRSAIPTKRDTLFCAEDSTEAMAQMVPT